MMWTPFLLSYGVGMTVTAAVLVQVQTLKHDPWTNVAAIVLWPFYWGYYGLTMFLNRRGR